MGPGSPLGAGRAHRRPDVQRPSETVASLPAFRDAFRRHRCLVPADGFYEWQRRAGGYPPGGRPAARPAFLIRRADRLPFAFAGLWASWRDPVTAERRRTFTIVTRAATDAVASLHDRMPVMVAPEDWATWLAPEDADPLALRAIIERPPTDRVEIVPVRPLVNSVRNQGRDVIEPLDAS